MISHWPDPDRTRIDRYVASLVYAISKAAPVIDRSCIASRILLNDMGYSINKRCWIGCENYHLAGRRPRSCIAPAS